MYCAYRLYTIESTQLRVMYGVMVHYCMRYGVLDTNHLRSIQINRYDIRYFQYLLVILLILLVQCIRLVDSGYRLPAPSGCPKTIYEIMINCWYVISVYAQYESSCIYITGILLLLVDLYLMISSQCYHKVKC